MVAHTGDLPPRDRWLRVEQVILQCLIEAGELRDLVGLQQAVLPADLARNCSSGAAVLPHGGGAEAGSATRSPGTARSPGGSASYLSIVRSEG